MKQKQYCNYCGAKLDSGFIEGKERQVCRACGQIYYENPLPVACIILPNEKRELLLVRRANEPARDMWCFPIGFAEYGESIEDAALRELKEEAGVDGKVLQIVDVCSEKTEPYGELVIVTFEAEKIGGVESAGDDACDCAYFPVMNLPKLAFGSQDQALRKFMELKRDTWNISDSFERFVKGTVESGSFAASNLLSDELIGVIESNARQIIDLWIHDISTNPSTRGYQGFDPAELFDRAIIIIGQLNLWLKGGKPESEIKKFYFELGKRRRQDNILIDELMSSLSLLKKHIFRFTSSAGIWYRPVDIYRVFELGERLVYFFDKATHYTLLGYTESG